MLCDICTKNQATVHLTEIVDNQMTELHLCEECARQKSTQMEQKFGLSDLLAGLADFGKHLEGKEAKTAQCPNCKLTYEDFKKIGRLGCSQCYTAFMPYLVPLLKRIHGSTTHSGKAPLNFVPEIYKGTKDVKEVKETKETKISQVTIKEKIDPKTELLFVKEKLQMAIKEENFEEAAKLRDRIKEIEKEVVVEPEIKVGSRKKKV